MGSILTDCGAILLSRKRGKEPEPEPEPEDLHLAALNKIRLSQGARPPHYPSAARNVRRPDGQYYEPGGVTHPFEGVTYLDGPA